MLPCLVLSEVAPAPAQPAAAGEGVCVLRLCRSPPPEQLGAALTARFPGLFVRKTEILEAPDAATPEIKSWHSRTGPRGKLEKEMPGGLSPGGGQRFAGTTIFSAFSFFHCRK